MLGYVYELFMSLVTMILGFFGIQIGKKSVSFAEDVKDGETSTEVVTSSVAETNA